MTVREMDSEIARIVDSEGSMTFSLTMAFDSTLCGYFNGKLITILDGRKKILPMSIVLDGGIKGKGYSVGGEITISRNEDADFVLSGRTKSCDLIMPVSGMIRSQLEMYDEIRTVLYDHAKDSRGMLPVLGFMGKIDQMTTEAGITASMIQTVAGRVSCLLSELESTKEITARNIVGYGVGLTPSADDFLIGVSAVLDFNGEHERKKLLSEYIGKHIDTTTEVSGWMLRYGISSKYPQIVIDSLINAGKEKLRVSDFLEHGSTSGIDLLCGLLCGLEIIIRERNNEAKDSYRAGR